MGQLECEWKGISGPKETWLTLDVGLLVGDLSMHAMCLAPSEARNPHLQGEIFEHGQLV